MPEVDSNDIYIDFEDFNLGLYALRDTTKAPFGSARIMENVEVTDRGGIGPRPGTELVGGTQSGDAVKGMFEFELAFGQDSFLVRAHDDVLEILRRGDDFWSTLRTGLTQDEEFGFASAIVNDDNQDYLVGSNKSDPFFRWNGAVSKIQSDSSGTLTVDSTLKPQVIESRAGSEVSSSSTTSITINSTEWAADAYNGLHIHILTGSESGQVREITDTTNDTLTFNAFNNDPGAADFEIKQLKFKKNDSILVEGTEYEYNDIQSSTEIETTSGSVSFSDPAYAVQSVREFPENPRGNRFSNFRSRIIVSGVRSAIGKDSSGNNQAYSTGGTVFVSRQKDPDDFTYSSPRNAGEGDLISVPYGGGDVTDIAQQEDSFYVFKKDYIEAMQYSQDGNDRIIREPLKSGIGSVGRVIHGADDVYFVTDDNRLTTLGRVADKDSRPQTVNIGRPIKRRLDQYDFGDGHGIEYKNRVYIPAKSDSDQTDNNILIVWNREEEAFEGIWTLNAGYLDTLNDRLMYSDSNSPDVYELFKGKNDTRNGNEFSVSAEYATHFMNLASNNGMEQAMNKLYFQGYISTDTEIKFVAYKEMSDTPFFEYTFDGSLAADDEKQNAFLGGEPKSLSPKGSVGEENQSGLKPFLFHVWFPYQYGNTFSIGFESSDAGADYEVTRFGMGLKESTTIDAEKVVDA